jgi:hypothetical protein
MAHGIETGNKKYKHIRRDDEKWLLTDLHEIKRTVQKYIARLQPPNENEKDASVKKSQKMLTGDIILGILVLGILGSMSLLTGLYLIIQAKYDIGVPVTVFGVVFVIAFILFEKYR